MIMMNNYCILNTVAGCCNKVLLTSGFSLALLTMVRSAVLFLVASLMGRAADSGSYKSDPQSEDSQQVRISLRDRAFVKVQVRSLFANLSFVLFTINLSLIPMTLIIIFFQTNPLWSSILGYCINRETTSPVELTAMLLSFGGVLTIAFSRGQGSPGDEPSQDALEGAPANAVFLGVFFSLCHAWLFAGVGVISRTLPRVHYSTLMQHQAVQGVVLAAFFLAGQALFTGTSLVPTFETSQIFALVGGTIADSLALASMCIAF